MCGGERKKRDTLGSSLGLDAAVRWFDWGGRRWHQFIPLFGQALGGRTAPDVLVIVCGSNDLGSSTTLDLVGRMKSDLQSLFPELVLVWSEINQRQQWRSA
ncbi:uncharacterized protein V6R79_019448 [Siganus canaliculatus]